ncbi:Zinc finger CCCH domain-containing protein [Quillaja saponaria]|uniref:Zinc finger CCCH domain-containing protein n=1 Tax=Quillaja saponaria TaxID=32244 RepID=A0AAD7QCS4_QUISA|nr:Zinc finger CCCH domain-containing protein [Quillaja saponaria]KAJ7978890.1 Zinc finger CCCH domain-containing protein [Quillaja saponaria]
MEEDLLKRNTDCVYFLASPLTCKKGDDCEYRHNEIARLNPRDCWYWLAGSCLNPICSFRHPPLDGHTGVPSESTDCSLPVNKTKVLCYYFFSGFCNKGDKCSFLHDPDDNSSAGKLASTDTIILENKTSAGNNTDSVSAPTEMHVNPSESAPNVTLDFKVQPNHLQHLVPKNISQQSALPRISSYEYEAIATKSASKLPAEGFIHLCTEQSSEEQVNNHVEPDERWESSSGFNVIVNNKSENFGYEDDSEYLLDLDRECSEPNDCFLGYEFEEPVEYDAITPDSDLLCESDIYDGYRRLDTKHILGNVRKDPIFSREIVLDSLLSRKRKRMRMHLADYDRVVDLRDHLRRRREISGHLVRLSRRHRSSLMIQNQERRQRRIMDHRKIRRLASEVGMSTGNVGTLSNARKLGLPWHSQQYRSKKYYKKETLAQRQFPSPKVSRKSDLRERRSTHESATFTGPKTLAQIKEEKKKAEESRYCKITSVDFQGPKPLSEILKEKGMLD